MSDWPKIRTVGLSGILVSFAAAMSEPANRAALAFRVAVEDAGWPEVAETSTSLVSVFLQVDLATTPQEAIIERLRELLAQANALWHRSCPATARGRHRSRG
jgi:inhibitor of KinA